MKKSVFYYVITIIGFLIIGLGIYLLKTISEPQGVMRSIPYLCMGIGFGIFGHGVGDIIKLNIIKRNPYKEKMLDIEKKDERNIKIINSAKAKAYDMMIYVFAILILAFIFIEVDLIVLLLLIAADLFMISCSIYYSYKYNKEM